MMVAVADFIKQPTIYLEKIEAECVYIMKDGNTIAVLAKPSKTPISDSLLGLLKDVGINNYDDMKAMKVER